MRSTSIHGLSLLPQTFVTRILLPSKQTTCVSNQDSFAAALTACGQKQIQVLLKNDEKIFYLIVIYRIWTVQVSLQR